MNPFVLDKLQRATAKPKVNLLDVCFDKQRSFIEDKARFKVAVCGRRAGKTIACAVDLLQTAQSKPNAVCLYITLSRNNAKKIIWQELLNLTRVYDLGAKVNETDLSLTFQNGSRIYISGASDKTEIEKFRGLAISLCYIDEAQSFGSYIETLIEDVVSKALYDNNGTLALTGTPGPIPSGYFYGCSTNENWSNHSWLMFDNPWIEKKSGKTAHALLDEDLKRKGVTRDDPTIQREVFAKWIVDREVLVYKYSEELNHYEQLPITAGKWSFIIGIDIGFDDADAIAVIGYNEKLKESYLIEELITKKQGITELADQVEALITKYDPDRVVMDFGGLGKKIAEEIRRRRQLPIMAAEKSRKFEYIELLNDALRTKRLFAKKDSRFASDSMLVEWDKDKSTPDKLKVSDKYHSDITDAVLYAFRESLHWLYEPEVITPKAGTPEWVKAQENEVINRLEAELFEQKQAEIFEFGSDFYDY